MNFAVVGSRDYQNLSRVRHYTRRLVAAGHTIVSGGARGVDAEAERAAVEMGQKPLIFPPDYTTHGDAAPWVRNSQIVDAADRVVAFWDGKSSGTLDTIKKAARADKTVTINPALFATAGVPEQQP